MDISSLIIETERLHLVPISPTYREEIFSEFSPKVTHFMYPRAAKDISETDAFIAEMQLAAKTGKETVLVVLEKETKEFLGIAGLHKSSTRTPELGGWIKESAWGHRYGREAFTAVYNWMVENLDYDYVLYPVDKDNIPSRKIPESLGGVIEREYDEKNMSGRMNHILEYRIYKKNPTGNKIFPES